MITAKDVQKKKFEKVKFGYSPEEVDAFLSQIENDRVPYELCVPAALIQGETVQMI